MIVELIDPLEQSRRDGIALKIHVTPSGFSFFISHIYNHVTRFGRLDASPSEF